LDLHPVESGDYIFGSGDSRHRRARAVYSKEEKNDEKDGGDGAQRV
jgi:hypothetical protein